jgi:hypothetical protein
MFVLLRDASRLAASQVRDHRRILVIPAHTRSGQWCSLARTGGHGVTVKAG